MSLPEVLLWQALRRRQAAGCLRFRRQHPLGPYVLDFYCDEIKLAVEVDGQSHSLGEHPERDERRAVWLAEQGVRTLRIPAGEVLASPEAVVTIIRAAREDVSWLMTSESLRTSHSGSDQSPDTC